MPALTTSKINKCILTKWIMLEALWHHYYFLVYTSAEWSSIKLDGVTVNIESYSSMLDYESAFPQRLALSRRLAIS